MPVNNAVSFSHHVQNLADKPVPPSLSAFMPVAISHGTEPNLPQGMTKAPLCSSDISGDNRAKSSV